MGIKEVEGMAAHWDEASVPLDNRTLLRGLDILDGIKPSDDHMEDFILSRPWFNPIRENDHLRRLLRDFLEADRAVTQHVYNMNMRSKLWFMTHRKQVRLQAERLELLKQIQKLKFDDYEMMRRLVCWDNHALARTKSR